jgi:Uma2 family endonuclease
MVALPIYPTMTADAYFAWEALQEDRYEYWDGEVVLMSGGTKKHNRVSFNASKTLDQLVRDRGCDVFISDVKVQVRRNRRYFYPDVVVTCDDRDKNNTQLVHYPCLIIEVLSPSTEQVDRGRKFNAYRRIETLQDYILISPEQPIVEVFSRGMTGEWILRDYGLDDTIELTSINCTIAVKDLYDRITFEEEEEDPEND